QIKCSLINVGRLLFQLSSSMYRSFHPDDGISRCGSTIDRSVTSYSMWRSDHAVTLRLFVAPGEFARVWRLRLPVDGPGRAAGGGGAVGWGIVSWRDSVERFARREYRAAYCSRGDPTKKRDREVP